MLDEWFHNILTSHPGTVYMAANVPVTLSVHVMFSYSVFKLLWPAYM